MTFLSLPKRAFASFALAMMLFVAPSAHADQNEEQRLESARTLVTAMAEAVKAAIEADYNDDDARIAAVDGLISDYFDFKGITRYSAGRYWKKASETERSDYTRLSAWS